MALYIPQSILHLARSLYVRPETYGPNYVHLVYATNHICMIASILEHYLLSMQQKCCDLRSTSLFWENGIGEASLLKAIALFESPLLLCCN